MINIDDYVLNGSQLQKPTAHIGIDPGQTGAAVLISETGIDYFDWPGDPVQFYHELKQWRDDFDIKMVLLESVHSMPKQGVSSSFKFGLNFGMIQGVLAGMRIPYMLVTPQKWQKGVVVPSDGKDSKERSLTVARRMFPQVDWLRRKKDHNRSDALLMAYKVKAGMI